MAEDTLLTAGNQTEGNATATGAADTGTASATAATTTTADGKANTETQQQGDQQKTGDDAGKQQDGAPEAYEYKLPEGMEFPTELRGDFDGLVKELGLSNEAAQRIVDFHLKVAQGSADSLTEAITAQQEQWLKDAKADKEIGGANLTEVGKVCSQVIEQLGTPELKAALNETGLGNHPELIRFVYKIGQQLGTKEGGIVTAGNAGSTQKPAAQILFGETSQQGA